MGAFAPGDRVMVETYDENEEIELRPGTVVDTFYEPGDPQQGVCVRLDNGQRLGSLCSSWCRPLTA